VNLVGVPDFAIPSLWEETVRPKIVECFEKTREHRWLPEDVLESLMKKDMQLWVLHDTEVRCFVVTEIIEYPRSKECLLFLVVGEIPGGWDDPMAQMEEWAKEQGCSHIATMGRLGTAKNVRKMGWDNRQTYCVKEL